MSEYNFTMSLIEAKENFQSGTYKPTIYLNAVSGLKPILLTRQTYYSLTW